MTGDACEPSQTGKISDTGVRDATAVCGEQSACQEVPHSLGHSEQPTALRNKWTGRLQREHQKRVESAVGI